MEGDKEKNTSKDENSGVVRTYAEDMAKVIEDDREGLVKKIIHGEEEHELEKKNLSPESKKNKVFMTIGFVLIFLSLAILTFLVLTKKEINTVAVQKQFIPIIFNDKSVFLEVGQMNKDEIVQSILTEIDNTEVKIGGVKGIYLTQNKDMIGLREFVSLLKSSFAPGSNTVFVNDNFMMGTVLTGLRSSSNIMGDFFILLKVRSIFDVFNTMKAWENKMFFDLNKFFKVDISSETSYLLTKDFEDGIMENKNARILYDKDGGIVMMYIFADENSVIITGSQAVAHEIMLRLASSEKKQ